MLLALNTATAQLPNISDDRCAGTTYYIAYPDTTGNRIDPRFPNRKFVGELSLWMFSTVPNTVRIWVNGSLTDVVNLQPGKFKVYTFEGNPAVTTINRVMKRGIKVEPDYPISLYMYHLTDQSAEAWTPIAVENWGTKYYAACIPGEVINDIGVADEVKIPHTPRPAPAEILVVAAYDNTLVTITPPPGIRYLDNPQSAVVVTLNEGEVYQVQSRVDVGPDAEIQDDIAASVIQSTKPVGVMSGNTRARVIFDDFGLKDNAYKNMLLEWLPPVEQHGTRFAWFPTWDPRRPGAGAVAERHREFARVYNTSGHANAEGFRVQPGGTKQHPFKIPRLDSQMEFSIGDAAAVYFETKDPSMVMMHSSAIIRQISSVPTPFGVPAQEFEGWAAYMAEVVPREQWTSFAPYYAPTNPSGMQHYISVVTDTTTAKSLERENGSIFPLIRRIPGTDLVWGTMSVTPGEDHWLYSRTDGKFTGVVFGEHRGEEKYRPGGTRRREDGKASTAGGGGIGAPRIAHPCEFEEYAALAYGYPLAPSRCVLSAPDSLLIESDTDCTALVIRIRAVNATPVGLRSVTLDPGTRQNARLVAVKPNRLADIIGAWQAEVRVEPIDPLQDASAVVIIKDRTGKVWRVPYTYQAERLLVEPAAELNFGTLTPRLPVAKTVKLTNPLNRPVKVIALRLADGNQGYAIVRSVPAVPTVLAPNASMLVEISSTPAVDNARYVDTLKAILECVQVKLPLITETARPVIYVDDVPFGVFVRRTDPTKSDPPRTKPMHIRNIGTGEIRFHRKDPADPNSIITWPNPLFKVDPAEIQALEGRVLKANEEIAINVTFDPGPAPLGRQSTVAWTSANTRDVRDTSVWTAMVIEPGPRITGYDWHDRWVVRSRNACTKDSADVYHGTVVIDNEGSSDDEVASLTLEGDDAPYFAFDNGFRGTTVQAGDILKAGNAKPLTQAVLFYPQSERPYACDVVLKTTAGSVISARLEGRGIESHGAITGFNFGTTKFSGPSAPPDGTAPIPGTVTLTARQTRTLTITGVKIMDDPANFFIDPAQFTGAGAFPWTMAPGETRTIDVQFRPQVPGTRTARVAFIGDHSLCDDSTNVLTGYSFTADLATRGYDFGTVLTCDAPEGDVEITNTGSEPLTLRGVRLNDPDGVFILSTATLGLPATLAPNVPLRIPARFTPKAARSYTGSVSFDVVNPRDNSVVPAADAPLVGAGRAVAVPASIGRDYHGLPGTQLVTPLVLHEPLDDVKATALTINLQYDQRAVKLTNGTLAAQDIASMTNGTLLQGWTATALTADPARGTYRVTMEAPPGTWLTGTGDLLRPTFRLFLGRVDRSELPFTVELRDRPCAVVNPTPGLIVVDPVCGVNLRLIEWTGGTTYALDQNHPNPFNPSTEISFAIGLDGPTKLTIYDAGGRMVATLLDAPMRSGKYTITWDAGAQPSGLYYCRLESGMWTKTSTMLLRK